MVVEDEWNTSRAAERDEFFRDAPDGGEVLALGAELEEIRAATEQRSGDRLGIFLRGVAEVEDGVEAGFLQAEHFFRENAKDRNTPSP